MGHQMDGQIGRGLGGGGLDAARRPGQPAQHVHVRLASLRPGHVA